MPKLFAMLMGIGALILSVNLPAHENVPGIVLAETRAYPQPPLAGVTLAPTQVDRDSTNSPTSADGAPNAWLCGLGFLGLVVLRRTRSGPTV